MKKTLILSIAILLSIFTWAQSPEKMSYQALLKDASNTAIKNQQIGMQISILQDSDTGKDVYIETQNLKTNNHGLVSLEIGNGSVVSGDFSVIDWAKGTYFIKTEIDLTGGTDYTITGISQFMSVPYALHAKLAKNITGTITEKDPVFAASAAFSISSTDTANWNTHTIDTDTHLDSTAIANMGYIASKGSTRGHYVGELFGGGIVFYVNANGQHGLIASLADINDENGAKWGFWKTVLGNCESVTDGAANTANIIAAGGVSNDAAGLCVAYAGGGFTDWYLPTNREFAQMLLQDVLIEKVLENDGNDLTYGFCKKYETTDLMKSRKYWSSMEYTKYSAWYCDFNKGILDNSSYIPSKAHAIRVRAVRAF